MYGKNQFKSIKQVFPNIVPLHPVTGSQYFRDGTFPRKFAPKIGRRVMVDVEGLLSWLRAEGKRQEHATPSGMCRLQAAIARLPSGENTPRCTPKQEKAPRFMCQGALKYLTFNYEQQ